jgi:hypothetical protein
MPPRKPPPRPFLERFGGLTTWMIGIVAGGLVNTGIMYQQFDQVKKNQADSKEEQKAQAAKLSEFREKQITGLADIQVLKGNVQNLDARVLVIERVFIERPAKEAKR